MVVLPRKHMHWLTLIHQSVDWFKINVAYNPRAMDAV